MIIPYPIPRRSKILTLLLISGSCIVSLAGQVDKSPGETADSTVVLSPFEVSTTEAGRYQSTEATSGGRVRIDVFDAPQSVSVISRDLIDDISAGRILDAAKYVSGITESTLSNGLDRTTIRGFQSDGTTVDGFASGNQQANLDPVLVERLEVVKGPNAVLSPSGVPGGTVNIVTRKPQFNNFGSISFQTGIYDAGRGDFDVNRVINGRQDFAFRVVGAYQNSESYTHAQLKNTTIMPMFTVRTKSGVQLVLQFEYVDFYNQNNLGIPIDPSSGSTNTATLLSGVPRNLNTYDNDFRAEVRKEGRAFLTMPLGESINARLAAHYSEPKTNFAQSLPSTNTTGGARDPNTGLYVPGLVFASTPPFASSPAPAEPRILPRGGQQYQVTGPVLNLQNDYVHRFTRSYLDATTLGGFAYNYAKQNATSTAPTKAPINYDAPAASIYLIGPINQRTIGLTTSEQAYISETAKVWDGRIAVNGGYSYNNYDLSVVDKLANTRTIANVATDLKSYGAVIKPISMVALYYSHSEVASPQSATTIASGGAPLSNAKQKEYGIRFEGWDKRILATLCHYEILQSAYSIPNPANLVVPAPNPLLPALLADRTAKGWEFEIRANITNELSIIGNATEFKNRDPNNVPFRGTAEKSGALLVDYRFAKSSTLSGLSIAVGADYLGRRPGDSASGLTAASTAANIIPNQPTFYLAPRTLVNLALNYKLNKNWSAQVNVQNLLDKQYIAGSLTRFTALAGTPINVLGRVTYSF